MPRTSDPFWFGCDDIRLVIRALSLVREQIFLVVSPFNLVLRRKFPC